ALEFLTGYVVEQSLSMDNLFVFYVLFAYFRVPPQFQRKVLYWGIFGALIMRGAFIFAGAALISRFHWVTYALGAVVVASGIKLLLHRGAEIDPSKNIVLRL